MNGKTLLALAIPCALPFNALAEGGGFVEDAHFSIKARNFYMNRNFLDERTSQNYSEEWAQGFIGIFESGFTQGTVGFGVDAIGLLGIKLDTGNGRKGGGTLLLEEDSDGAKDSYGYSGAALKAKFSNTVFKYGDQLMNLPVLATSDNRLLPETTQGWLLTSKEIDGLTLHAGHFTALRSRDQSEHDSGGMTTVDLVGGNYQFNRDLSARLYHSDVDDYWRKTYAGATAQWQLSPNWLSKFDFNGYDTRSQGRELGGKLDNRIWSLSATLGTGPHSVMIAHQRVSGDGNYTYGVDGNSTVFLANSVQYSDFNYENERSWQARYDFDFAAVGVPGLTFMTRYLRGTGFHTAQTNDGKAWERDIELKYVVQSGAAKDLSMRVRQASFRSADRGLNFNEVRLITEYPLNVF
ncbi:OprD family porin [Pseudomonas putida CSV86]|uniref:OprD family porin n=1 Tax=Pseudomonas bharatica CSV86 TaxID=1005395 RepID=L1LTK7_9PSED|nr:OprD family porin [Pseudomonas bharatica]NNJ15079.1 OprD family porin [Pseudomonas bharatica CSV86]